MEERSCRQTLAVGRPIVARPWTRLPKVAPSACLVSETGDALSRDLDRQVSVARTTALSHKDSMLVFS